MSETRAPYRATPRPRIVYPGSRLELLVECLDEIAEMAPDAYPLRANRIHTQLRATLQGEIGPTKLLAYLMSEAGQ